MRFRVSVRTVPTKNTAGMCPLMRRGMRLAGRSPGLPASDAAPNMAKPCSDVFRARGPARKTEHGSHTHLDRNNGRMEGFNGVAREGDKTSRPTRRAGSPAIDGMRARHGMRPRSGLAGITSAA